MNLQGQGRIGYWSSFLFVLLSFLVFNQACSGYSEPIEMDQSLRVEGNENLSYINENLVIDGNIEVGGDASLLFRDCNITILWSQFSGKSNILVSDRGVLRLENSTVWIRLDTEYHVSTIGDITIQDQANLILDSSTILSTDIIFMSVRNKARVEFTDSMYFGKAPRSSQHRIIEDMMPRGVISELNDDYCIYVQENAVLTAVGSELGVVDLSDDTWCSINNSRIAILSPYSSKETQCSESEITIISMSQMNSNFTLNGTLSGYYDLFILEEALGSDTGGNLRLIDSRIEKVRLSLVDCKSEIMDANLWQLTISGGETNIQGSEITIANLYYGNITITDSEIPYLLGNCRDGKLRVQSCECLWVSLTGHNRDGLDYIWAEFNDTDIETCVINYMSIVEEADIFLRDVTMYNLSMKAAPRFEMYTDNCVVENRVTLTSLMGAPMINLRGTIEFYMDDLVVYGNTILHREYEIRLQEDGEPSANKQVQLVKDSVTIDNATSNQEGLLFFDVYWEEGATPDLYWYDKRLYDIDEPLIVRVGDTEREIRILSDTPVEIELAEPVFPVIYAVITTGVLVLFIAFIFIRKRL